MPRYRLDETPLNWAALNLLQEWNKQEKEHKYKVARLRPLFRQLVGALAIHATIMEDPDDESTGEGIIAAPVGEGDRDAASDQGRTSEPGGGGERAV